MSKFDKIFTARIDSADENVSNTKPRKQVSGSDQNKTATKTRRNASASREDKVNKAIANGSTEKDDTPVNKKRGRPATGKRNDPDYLGFTTYIRKNTHIAVKIKLLQEGENRELSELVEELLFAWLKK